MLNFDFSEEQNMFRKAIREFAEKEIGPTVEESERAEKFQIDLYRRLGELGYLAVSAPEEIGGMDGGAIMECIMLEELARISSSFAGSVGISPFVVTPVICNFGTKEQVQRFIVPTIRGEKIGSVGITEPDAGSDVSAIRTTARRDGDEYILNGSKIFISNGPIADYVLTLAYTDRSKGPKGTGIFIVERGMPGFSVSKKLEKMAGRGSETAELVFDNCRVPAANVVGSDEGGFKKAMAALNSERVGLAGLSLGLARAGYEAALKYAQERVQFGKPIGKFQAIAFKLAEMATSIETARHITYYAAWLHDNGRPCVKESSMAKLHASEVAVAVCREAIQIHGGYGLMAEFPTTRYLLDALLGCIIAGTSEIQKMIILKEIGL